ncbi:arginine/serine-rich protein PNISR isoform X2 [Teleopsis dalmanni]|uniref:arginine/serine-rich protein PNISR isoform X2 n=1 Tax=Teleopsis dalmanni TaxID=139649 RepID=UPI0018CCFBBA|nr:arginine/serine-rich protein PNISR isoform X2 [Teleopsis dalmanni]
MFSGGDSSGDGFKSRKQLTNYFTAPTGNIDWASLAQQWIQMQSTGNNQLNECIPETTTTCTTKNSIVKSHELVKTASSTLEEKGEADMDMDEESDIDRNNEQSSPPPPAPNISSLWYMHQPPQSASTPVEKDIINPQNSSQWNIWPPQVTMPPPSIANVSMMNPTAHIPSLMKINVANPNSGNSVDDNIDEGAGTSSACINAAKRKKLPAWIREGLEKMEREKQKQLEKEQQNQNVYQDNSPTAVVPNEKELYVKDDMVNEIHISEKKMASESSGNEEEEDNNENAVFTVSNESISSKKKLNNDDRYTDNIQNSRNDKSFEEKMANLMVDVRRTLTELLLEVTNEEISNIAVESLKSCKLKASSAQLIHKVALSSLTGKLGLTAYDDSSSGESSDSSNERSDDDDTDEELKVTIRAKHRAFSKISSEIEERLVASAAMEEQKIKYYKNLEQQGRNGKGEVIDVRKRDTDEQDSVSSSSKNVPTSLGRKGYTKEFGKWQKDRSSFKERTTRFSDNKDSRSKSIATTATYISQIQNSSNVITPNMSTTSLVSTGVQDPNGLYTAANACITKDSNKLKKSEESSSRKRSRSHRSSSSSSSETSSSSSSSKKRRRREHSSSRHRSHKKSDRERNNERRRHKHSYRSSESDDEHYYKRSRHTRNHSRSRSKSRSSYSSTKHRRY